MDLVNSGSLDKYNSLFERYLSNIRNNSFLFEVCKCCGYSELVPLSKNATCEDLYKSVIMQFQLNQSQQVRLYVYTIDVSGNLIFNNDLFIQNNNKSLRDFISENNQVMRPLYPIPANVVYKLCFDDGHACGCSANN